MNAVTEVLHDAELAARALLPGAAVKLAAVPGGANNRAWRVEGPGGPFLLKQYYRQPPPARDRYASERAFYTYAMTRTPDAIPRSVGWNDEHRAGLFEFVGGRKLTPAEVTDARVDEAMDFFRALNRPPAKSTTPLPDAAEACFRVVDHLALVGKRVERLQLLPNDGDETARAARQFVTKNLEPAWHEIQARAQRRAETLDATAAARGASPSDFGFHNALLESTGRLRFFDFEYAGWDDPAKTIGDFLCQPEIPAGWTRRTAVATAIAELFPDDVALPERAELLLPVYQIKWCCILLNEFLPADDRRRSYALGADAARERRQTQLRKAQAALEQAQRR